MPALEARRLPKARTVLQCCEIFPDLANILISPANKSNYRGLPIIPYAPNLGPGRVYWISQVIGLSSIDLTRIYCTTILLLADPSPLVALA